MCSSKFQVQAILTSLTMLVSDCSCITYHIKRHKSLGGALWCWRDSAWCKINTFWHTLYFQWSQFWQERRKGERGEGEGEVVGRRSSLLTPFFSKLETGELGREGHAVSKRPCFPVWSALCRLAPLWPRGRSRWGWCPQRRVQQSCDAGSKWMCAFSGLLCQERVAVVSLQRLLQIQSLQFTVIFSNRMNSVNRHSSSACVCMCVCVGRGRGGGQFRNKSSWKLDWS